MDNQEHEFITARQFAEAIDRPYPTVALWLRKGLVPGVKEIQLGKTKLWQVPAGAVWNFVPPRRGRPPKPIGGDGEGRSSLKKPATRA